MKAAMRWMAGNHVAANLLMMVFVVGGLILGVAVKQEVFPEVILDKISVTVPYPGAGPEEVEEGILRKIEENLTGVTGIKQIKSTAFEGSGQVMAELLPGEDADKVLQEVKSEIDRITTFPRDAEKPIITKVVNRREVISVVVYGDLSELSLRQQGEQVRDELLSFPEITQVDLGGVRPYEISIEIAEQELQRYQLTLDGVSNRVRQASLDLPGGTIKSSGGDILLRTKERRYSGDEYAALPLITRPDGTQLRLGAIATIHDSFAETDESARFDGQAAAMVKIYRVGEQKPTEISKIVRTYVADKEAKLPPTVHLAAWNDTSEMLQSRMTLLTKNAVFGLILVFIVLGLFLEIRLALWVMLGIPISFLGALFFMPILGVSINMVSLFAFILALGIVIDDAIVVGENVYEQRQLGKSYFAAAVDGVSEVGVPVIFSILTTVAAFLPLVFISGTMGKFIKVIPLVVIAILFVSLIESLFVLPAHLALGAKRVAPIGLLGKLERVRLRFGHHLARFSNGPYRRFLQFCLHYRYATVAVALAMLFLTIGVVRGGVIKFVFMPEVDGDVIQVSLQMPRGTPVAETSRVARLIADAATTTVAEYDRQQPAGETILRHLYSNIGATISSGGGPTGASSSSGSHLASLSMFLTKSEDRGIPAAAISAHWRQVVGEIPGIESLTFKSNLVQMGANIDVQLAHEDFNVLAAASGQLRRALGEYPGVTDIADTFARGKREMKLQLTPAARTLGVTEENLGRQVRAAFYGAEALRLQRGRNEVKVMVRYPEEERRSLLDLTNLRIRTPDGGELPLPAAATISEGRGFSEINRSDRKRVINVSASVDSEIANAGEILADLKNGTLATLVADYPGLSFDLEGEEKERADSMASMAQGFGLALFAIYALLAIPFRSYSQPFLIMAAIPFGVVGAIIGHLIMGYNLSLLSLFGVVALSGVVVNDSLLLIDRVNGARREGLDVPAALLEAAQRRFRPILLTSLTTFFGLMPMILERSVQAQFLIPMAISLGFGVLFATAITLLLIPCLYLLLEDARRGLGLRSDHGVA